jgi:polyhydroxyalkanoate synthesis regulator protein
MRRRITTNSPPPCMAANEPVLIKRCDNQQFYDVGCARYLTIDDLVAWQAMSLCFEVRDAKTGEDVTAAVLAKALGSDDRDDPEKSVLVSLEHDPSRGG